MIAGQTAQRRAAVSPRIAPVTRRAPVVPGGSPRPHLTPIRPRPVEQSAQHTDLQRPTLSTREREVLRMWVMTDTKTEAAQRLFLSPSTVSTHITRIRQKYDDVGRSAKTKATLLVRALQDEHIRLDELE